MQGQVEKKKALIVVRTYPTPAKQGVEVSCTAAITDKGEWLRLFPVPWRLLPQDQRFRKYQWIQAQVIKARDVRPESFKLVADSIKILDWVSPANEWQGRKDVIFRLRSPSLCSLKKERDEKGHPTLGVFRPKKIESLVITPASPSWKPAQLDILRQGHLFEKRPQQELEKVPYNFQYHFYCDDPNCLSGDGHTLKCTDWEMGESWRKWKGEYGKDWESKFRQKYETEMIERFDTHFYVGTMHKYPDVWLIVGLFYPPLSTKPPTLFE